MMHFANPWLAMIGAIGSGLAFLVSIYQTVK